MSRSPRTALAALAASALLLSACATAAEDDGDALRVAALTSYNTLTLSQELAGDEPLAGAEVVWRTGFEAFAPSLEAAAAGEVDAGSGGLTNLFTALAEDAEIVVIGIEDAAHTQGIVAGPDSGISGIEDLAGASIAVNQGGTGEYLALRALERAGLGPDDAELRYLSPADAISAFQSGHVDAIATWDQFLATAQQAPGAEVIATGEDIEARNHVFHWVTGEYAAEHPEVVDALVERLQETSSQARAEPQAVLDFYAAAGAGQEILDVIGGWEPYALEPIDAENAGEIAEHGQDLLDYGLIAELPELEGAMFIDGAIR